MTGPTSPRVAVIDLGRKGALGAARRVASWETLWRSIGADVTCIRLVETCRTRRPVEFIASVRECVRRDDIAPESLMWSRRALVRELDGLRPDVVVYTTARSFHPDAVRKDAVTVLDYVDRLSESYRQRAELAGSSWRSSAYNALAARHRQLEAARHTDGVVRTAAGALDADILHVDWVPNVVDVPACGPTDPDVDLLFVGSLGYRPNVEAIRRLARLWPDILSRRPQTSLLLAGASPTPEVLSLAKAHSWELVADFASLPEIVSRARVSVAPLAHACGIQNKVLETAAFGLPQVIDPSVAAGLGPDFPAVVAPDDESLVASVVRLLDQPGEAARCGQAARRHVAENFSTERWGAWCAKLLPERVASR
jgi:glycosyltransferase involved in cell wall biosynthesis